MLEQRYDRQARIDGWNQSKINSSTLTIVGYNKFSEYLALSASALGIGCVRVIETPYDFTNSKPSLTRLSGKQGIEGLEAMMKNMGNSRFQHIKAHMKNKAEQWFLEGSDAVVDASLRDESRALSLDYALRNHSYCELLGFEGSIQLANVDEDPFGISQGAPDSIVSMITAGVVLEEIKKHLFGYEIKREPIDYHIQPSNGEDYSKLNALVVGAGALGNFVVSGLALLGFENIDIVDHDIIDETNLNRQLLFYNAVGMPKATTLAERCMQLREGANYTGIEDRFDKDIDVSKYSVVFDCVDNFETRLIISRRCSSSKIPLISGGTSYRAGQVVVYSPYKTSCPEHVINLETAQNSVRERVGCIVQPDPSVIMTNEVTAGIMLDETRKLFFPDTFGSITNGLIRYEAAGQKRFGRLVSENLCGD